MKIAKLILSLVLALLVVGCSSSNPGDSQPPLGGIGRTGFAVGPISTFGSIVVNGVRYDTSSASFSSDGIAISESDLAVGQIAVVRGSIDDNLVSGSADSVTVDDVVTGPVGSVDVAGNQVIVLGQVVLVTPDTSFDDSITPASLAGLEVGDIVEVYGFITATGEIEATRIEGKPAGTQFEVHGTVSNLDSVSFNFTINGLVVDYSSAMLDNFPGGQLGNGDFVEAKGTSIGGAGQLLATRVEFETLGVAGGQGDHVEIEGFITRFASAADFDVSGFPVMTTSGTVYEGGTAADLGLNIKVEVEGELDANNVLVADKVDIRRGKAVRATAVIDSVNVSARSFEVLGITVSVDNLTRMEDKSSADVRPLGVGDLVAGDYVEIRGSEFPAGSGRILATIVEREDPDPRTILQGFVSAVADPTLTILGVTIETDGAVFRDVDDSSLSRSAFFGRVGIGTLVKASGTETSATVISASEAELEVEF